MTHLIFARANTDHDQGQRKLAVAQFLAGSREHKSYPFELLKDHLIERTIIAAFELPSSPVGKVIELPFKRHHVYATESHPGQLRFSFACAALLLLGCALRLHPWQSPASPTPSEPVQAIAAETTSASAAATAAEPALPPQVLQTLTNFYERLDRGWYPELYDTVLEGKWQAAPEGKCTFAGFVPQDEFVATVLEEFEPNGAGINILSYRVIGASQIEAAPAYGSPRPEPAVLAHLPESMQLRALYELQVVGDTGPACLPKSWSKRLYIANFSGDDWRVLLAVNADLASQRKNLWFADGVLCPGPP